MGLPPSVEVQKTTKWFNDAHIVVGPLTIDVFAEQSSDMWHREPTGKVRIRIGEGYRNKFVFPEKKDGSFSWDKIVEQVRISVAHKTEAINRKNKTKTNRAHNTKIAHEINDMLHIPFDTNAFLGEEYRSYNSPHASVGQYGKLAIDFDTMKYEEMTPEEVRKILEVVREVWNAHHPIARPANTDIICEKCGNSNDDRIINGQCSVCRGTNEDLVEENGR